MNNNEQSDSTLRLTWPPLIGVLLGSAFVLCGILIYLGWMGAHWMIDPKYRSILALVVVLFGVLRIAQFAPRLRNRKRKSLREEIDELEDQ